MKIQRQVLATLVILLLVVGTIQYWPQTIYGAEGTIPNQSMATKLQGVIALHVDSPTALVNNVETKLDASNDFLTPLLLEGRVLVPVRFIAESLGGTVFWDQKTQVITINLGKKVIQLTLQQPIMLSDGQELVLEVPPTVYFDRTYVPLRAVTEAFGKKVEYQEGLVTIAESSVNLDPAQNAELWAKLSSRLKKLPVVGSEQNLRRLLAAAQDMPPRLMLGGAVNNLMKTAESAPTTTADAASKQYSQTNLQVQGVDEADLVKTDGKYIYQVSGQKVIISQAYPAEDMKVVTVLNSGETNFAPQELYVDQDKLVIIGRSSANITMQQDLRVSTKMIMPPYYNVSKTKAIIYNIQDKSNITKIRELELDGNYISSRKIGNALYLVAKQNINSYPQGGEPITLPAYRDSVLKAESIQVPYSQINCFPPVIYANYLIIAGLDLTKSNEAAQVSVFLGSGDNIYVSENHLYVAVNQQSGFYPGIPVIMEQGMPENREEKTLVYKFALNQGEVTYLYKGEVPGRILNQFSMDEFKDNFRIATTVGHSWNQGMETSRNNLYVLDRGMSIVGRVEDIAPGEQIYSTRFMGERAYMVTFKTVDPLFVLDLQDPQKPQILGALKIPGYSDYLHPYDANHIIGFGKDTVEVPQKDYQGKNVGTTAFYQGMKLALFDVTDVVNPKELFTEKIGDRGTSSELLYNHKALLFDKERGLLAFPVTVMQVPGANTVDQRTAMPQYGQFSFQGAYVYNLNLTQGFTLQGRISHLSPEDYLKAGYSGPEPTKQVARILYIDEMLYTISDSLIKANVLDSLVEKNKLILP